MSKGSYMELFNQPVENYLEQHTTPEDDVLAELNRETHVKMMRPQMLSGHVQGKFLEFISRLVRPQRILEIGTFTGYSTICLAKGLTPEGRIYTIDHNDELKGFTEHYFKKAGISQQVKCFWDDALKVMDNLQTSFDLAFIDADKHQYNAYFDSVLKLLKPGGVILVDNVLWYGKVLDETSDEETLAIKAFNRYMHNHAGVEQVMLAVRDGLFMAIKK